MHAAEKVAAGERSCWCPACVRAVGLGEGMEVEGKVVKVVGCEMHRTLTLNDVKRTDAAGVVAKRRQAQAEGHRMAAKLGLGMFVALQAREAWSTSEEVHHRPGHYWLGRTVDAGNGSAIARKIA